ncbi:33645_t:CDS:2 [Gigaspora margarita]|uniref:33645_t:CDS:1 n=1 Tax=Gigaspora margarita TaxID=4874 RepID=A0ABM8VXK9_GIGMA|nr:33645_t:CDS:2 [Gigaspora margarita]
MASKIIHMVVIESETSAKQSEEPPTKSKFLKINMTELKYANEEQLLKEIGKRIDQKKIAWSIEYCYDVDKAKMELKAKEQKFILSFSVDTQIERNYTIRKVYESVREEQIEKIEKESKERTKEYETSDGEKKYIKYSAERKKKTQGIVKERLNKTTFKVELDNGNIVLAYKASKFRVPKNHGGGTRNPTIVAGDKVKVDIPEKDLSKGMVVGLDFPAIPGRERFLICNDDFKKSGGLAGNTKVQSNQNDTFFCFITHKTYDTKQELSLELEAND